MERMFFLSGEPGNVRVTMAGLQPAISWRPDKFAVAAAGMLATTVVVAMLIFMFNTQPGAVMRVMPVELRLESTAVIPRATLKSTHVQPEQQKKFLAAFKSLPILKVEKIPLTIIAPLSSPPIDWQQQLQMSVKSQTQANSGLSASPLNRIQAFTPLQQALNAPRKPETMQNGDSYRSIYGGVILQSDGMCSELQTIQTGPSPSDQATIAFPGHRCAGNYLPSMADELAKWADQEAKKQPPP
jgi:hypothetical protein